MNAPELVDNITIEVSRTEVDKLINTAVAEKQWVYGQISPDRPDIFIIGKRYRVVG